MLLRIYGEQKSIYIELSKTQLPKIIQSGGFLGALLDKLAGLLMKIDVPLAKQFLVPLAIMISASAIDGAIQTKLREESIAKAGKIVYLVISNEDMDDSVNVIRSLENSGVLIDGASETIKHEIKKEEGGFLDMLLGTLGTSVLGYMLTGKV